MIKYIIYINILLTPLKIFGQDTLSIMTYNVLNFPGSTAERVRDFRKVLDDYRPDILVVNEMLSESDMILFMDSTLNHTTTEYSAGPIFEGFDSENSVYYKHDRLEFVDALSVTTALRRIDGYRFKIKNHADSTFQFQIFSAHLKASQGTDNVAKRLAEVINLDDSIKSGNVDSSYIFACDCNFYTSTESGYQYLIESMAIDLEDPINSPGSWHNNSSFASIHTQSTRTTQFGGGASGGLDDRFDFILLSEKFFDNENLTYVDGSYTSIGNDASHFNMAINDGTNGTVSADIADALHAASDHLPVMLKLAYPTENFPVIELSRTVIDFGSVDPGSNNTQTFKVSNTGGSDLIISNITIDDPNFRINDTSAVIGIGGEKNFIVTFNPHKTNTTFTGQLRIYSNTAVVVTIRLEGNTTPVSIMSESDNSSLVYSLSLNYPNPFNPTTTIKYTLPKSSKVLFSVYNLSGEEISRLLDEEKNAGYHQVNWDASNSPSGIYFYRLQAGDFVQTRKMVLLK